MADFTLTIRGDQLGSFITMSGNGNGVDRVVTLTGVNPIGTASEIYTVLITQAASGATEFENGQLVTIVDSLGNVVMSQTNVQPDIEQGLGAGDEHLILQNAGLFIDLNGILPGGASGGVVTFSNSDLNGDASLGDNDGQLDFNEVFPCFAAGTKIRTPFGERPIETLRKGSLVFTLDSGVQPIKWIRSRSIEFTTVDDAQRPIKISTNSLQKDVPYQDLIVSPQHRVLSDVVHGQGNLLPAKGLSALKGVRVMKGCKRIEYYTILLPKHEVIWANGCPCESFYPGNYIVSQLGEQLRSELYKSVPLLRFGAELGYGSTVRPAFTVQATRKYCTSLDVAV